MGVALKRGGECIWVPFLCLAWEPVLSEPMANIDVVSPVRSINSDKNTLSSGLMDLHERPVFADTLFLY